MATFHGTNSADIINATEAADTIFGNGGSDRLIGKGGDDVIRGGSGQDIVEGGAGNDLLFADSNEGGEDVMFGGSGSDILVSGTGSDHFNGGSEIDAASWQESAFSVTANLTTGRANNGNIEDTFTGVENLIGSRFSDALRGDNNRNELFGGEGNDNLDGEAGNDHLSGGAGNDTLNGGAGINSLKGGAGVDTIDYGAMKSAVHVDMEQGIVLSGDRQDSITEIEVIRGSVFADTFVGDDFGNRLSGMSGADEIDGGGGNDILAGGTSADTFVFVASSGNRFIPGTDSGFDRITDFDRKAGDHIDLSSHKEATDFADLVDNASQFGTDTHLQLGVDTVVIEDLALGQLSAQMFIF